MYYYTNPKPLTSGTASSSSSSSPNAIPTTADKKNSLKDDTSMAKDANGKKVNKFPYTFVHIFFYIF